MNSSFVIPVTFWSSSQPCFRISSLCVTPNLEKLVTGSFSGQLCLWDLDLKNGKLTPRNVLIGHKNSITCLVCTNEYVISSCESKRIFRWNVDDGYCSKMNQTSNVHRKMALFRTSNCDEYIMACGDYSEILIIHPFTLQVIFILYSKVSQDWISSFQIYPLEDRGNFVCGVTANGCVKFWTFDEFTNESQFELKSQLIPMMEIVDLKYSSNQAKFLIVSFKSFSLYDSEMSTCLCKFEASCGEKLLGGNIYENIVIVWSKSGKFYFYDVSKKQNLISVILDEYTRTSVFGPSCDFTQFDVERYLIKGDFWGKISIWKINEQEKQLQPLLSSSLADNWITDAFFNSYVKYTEITCCIYVLQMDKFFMGCHNGCVVSIPATQSVTSFYFYPSKDVNSDIFIGHNGKINCLLYPHEKYSHYNESHLVSGGSDFSVCLWDVRKVELLYRFCVQSGEILELIVPPENCSPQVKFSICSISLDNSVAVLNLRDPRCVILTSGHTFPVIGVHWRPKDDFIIVECFDGTVYVWQIETGHLDRVIDGIPAQEIVYACNECCTTASYNFYINEPHFRDSAVNGAFAADENAKNTLTLSKFFVGNSENHLFLFDLVPLFVSQNLESSLFECSTSPETHLLAQAVNAELEKKTHLEKLTKDHGVAQELEISKNNNVNPHPEKAKPPPSDNRKFLNESTKKKMEFFLSAVHVWGLNPSLDEILTSKLGVLRPAKLISLGVISRPGVLSLLLPTPSLSRLKIPSLVTSVCVSVAALSKIMKSDKPEQQNNACWDDLVSFYEKLSADRETVPKMNVEMLCKLWQNKRLPMQKIAHRFLCKHLQVLEARENDELLEFWYKYLPHFKILDRTLPEKVDFENIELKTVALVLFGAVGSDFKFKTSALSTQENYTYQTCASFVYLLLLPNSQKIQFGNLRTIAVDFIGRGYIVWEQFLKMEKIVPVLLEVCSYSSETLSQINNVELSEDLITTVDMYLTAQNALKSIAIARTAAFINCLNNEVNNIKSGKADGCAMENSKPEILSILSYLLEKTPHFMLLYLSDVISLIVYCIDFRHLKQENLSNLFPVMQRFRQVHHSVASQKIAVGLATGSLVLHDLRTGRAIEVSAHKDSVSALKFSEDGKYLASYSCYENKLSCWQILTGMFGFGQFHVKRTKSCQTYRIHDEEIRNHMEIASLTWTNKKSVLLSLCDGTEDVFEF